MRHHLTAVFLACLALSGCEKAAKPPVTNATISLPAVQGRPGAAYFMLNGGTKETRLMEVQSNAALRVELHETGMKDGMMTMAKIEGGVAVPVQTTVQFAPGGKHAMLFDMKPGIKPGDAVKLTFVYASGKPVTVDATAKAPGEAGGGHAH